MKNAQLIKVLSEIKLRINTIFHKIGYCIRILFLCKTATIIVTDEIRDAYQKISDDYLLKKKFAWKDFEQYVQENNWEVKGTIIDIGGGNGRNLLPLDPDFPIVLDISIPLLRGYTGPEQGNLVAGALPSIPFRDNAADYSLLIAVIHHFRKEKDSIETLENTKRITQRSAIISVWRKWRKGLREVIFEKIRKGYPTHDLANHERPWKNSLGEIKTTRFYHYFTFKELHYLLSESGFKMSNFQYLGGKHNDANIFVTVN